MKPFRDGAYASLLAVSRVWHGLSGFRVLIALVITLFTACLMIGQMEC